MAESNSHRLTAEEARQIRQAESRLRGLSQDAEQAHSEGRLADVIRDMPTVRQQLDPVVDA